MRYLASVIFAVGLVGCSGGSDNVEKSDDPRDELSWEAKSCDHAVVRLETDRLLNGENARDMAHETLKEKCLTVSDEELIKLYVSKLKEKVAPSSITTSSEAISTDKLTVSGLMSFLSSDGVPSDKVIDFEVTIDPLKGWVIDIRR